MAYVECVGRFCSFSYNCSSCTLGTLHVQAHAQSSANASAATVHGKLPRKSQGAAVRIASLLVRDSQAAAGHHGWITIVGVCLGSP